MDLIMWEIISRHPSQAALTTGNSAFITITQRKGETRETAAEETSRPE